MTDSLLFDSERLATLAAWLGAVLASVTLAAVVVERLVFANSTLRRRRIEQRYAPIIRGALAGDPAAQQRLAGSPKPHRFAIAQLMAVLLQGHRDPERIARARAIFEAMSLVAVADLWLRSRVWWKRATAIRAFGALQITTYSPAIVAALDDDNADVRAVALDAIIDLRDPASVGGLVARLHDESLHRGRRLAALAAFGPACEPYLLDLASVDAGNRLAYARALHICGTERSVPLLSQWTGDDDVEVRAAAFEALGHVGLDARTAPLAIEALECGDVRVRETAAHALRGWRGPGDIAAQLAQHLDDQWPVAVRAAQSLKRMGQSGLIALQSVAPRPDLAGELARQTLWEIAAQW